MERKMISAIRGACICFCLVACGRWKAAEPEYGGEERKRLVGDPKQPGGF